MKVSLNWIKEFTEIEGTIGDLVERIGSHLVEVEELIDWGARFENIIVGEIVETSVHENADKLTVYKVATGHHHHNQVVSGDQNLRVGDKVGYLLPGATIPSTYDDPQPVVMQERPLRGVLSQGMFGSAKELCFSQENQNVLRLDTNAPAGTPLVEAYDLDDIIIDIDNKSFTHRPDCFGVIGLSREIAAIQGRQFVSPSWFTLRSVVQEMGGIVLPLTVKNELPELCERYMAIAIGNISIGPSPLTMQSMLTRMGIRPINAIVDATNYLMLLTGQPLHAYDYDKVKGDAPQVEIVVRHPNQGERLELLDGRVITPRSEAILIANHSEPIALAGVMGGASTEVGATTKNIILEAANFNLYNIRSTSMVHGVFTDAVTRFAKGPSPEICASVLNRAAGLVLELSSGSVVGSQVVDSYATPQQNSVITVESGWVNALLGTHLSAEEMATILRNAECAVVVADTSLAITVPFWRSDLRIDEDIADEIGRLYGFDSIPPTIVKRHAHPITPSREEDLIAQLRKGFSAAGANEALTYDFVSKKLMEQSGQDVNDAYRLANSISPDLAYVRMTLLPSLLAKVRMNHKAGFDAFALYEIAPTHSKKQLGEDGLPLEPQALAFVWSATDVSYDLPKRGAAFYQAKQYLEAVLRRNTITDVEYRLLRSHTVDSIPEWLRNRVGLFDLNRSATVVKDDIVLGIIGEPSTELRKSLKLPRAVAMFEFGIEQLLAVTGKNTTYTPIINLPSVEQDVCFKLPADVRYSDVELYVRDFMQATDFVCTVSPVDIYQREDDVEHKQITIRIKLQHPKRTLTTKEVNAVIDDLAEKVHQVLRGERV